MSKQWQSAPRSASRAVDEEEANCKRLVRECLMLQEYYAAVQERLPVQLSTEDSAAIRSFLHNSVKARVAQASLVVESGLVSMPPEDELVEPPRYYYSELRRRRNCDLPPKPGHLDDLELMRLLSVEAVADMRQHEHYSDLATADGPSSSKLGKVWAKLGESSQAVSMDALRCLLSVWEEDVVIKDLRQCLAEEQSVLGELAGGVEEGEDSDEDDEDDEFCPVRKPLFIVSDCTGESANNTLNAALGQFSHCFDRSCPVNVTVYKFVRSVADLDEIVKEAARVEAMILFTLVDPGVNSALVEKCREANVRQFDMWSRLLDVLEDYLDERRAGRPGRKQRVDEQYEAMIECIEFSRQEDDGVNPKRWHEADLLLVGPSRSGKTPLSFYMAQRGYKVANYPLVPGESPPAQLGELDQSKIVALTITPQRLSAIRSTRMKGLRMKASSKYAAMSSLKKEIQWCHELYKKHGWPVLDTTDAGVEENAAEIMRLMATRSGGPVRSAVSEQFGMISPSCM